MATIRTSEGSGCGLYLQDAGNGCGLYLQPAGIVLLVTALVTAQANRQARHFAPQKIGSLSVGLPLEYKLMKSLVFPAAPKKSNPAPAVEFVGSDTPTSSRRVRPTLD
jgi:hypothetical protein